ncbi:hypothetical protein BDV06DRAFT_5042 [Aspergillus oleicola]
MWLLQREIADEPQKKKRRGRRLGLLRATQALSEMQSYQQLCSLCFGHHVSYHTSMHNPVLKPKRRGHQLKSIHPLAESRSNSRKLMYRILCRHLTSETRLDRSMDPSCIVTTRSAPSAREHVT